MKNTKYLFQVLAKFLKLPAHINLTLIWDYDDPQPDYEVNLKFVKDTAHSCGIVIDKFTYVVDTINAYMIKTRHIEYDAVFSRDVHISIGQSRIQKISHLLSQTRHRWCSLNYVQEYRTDVHLAMNGIVTCCVLTQVMLK